MTNGGEQATENLQIVDELRDGLPPPNDLIATINIDVSSNPVLDPGETACYSYRIDLPAGTIHAGGTYKNTANITITNHSGHLGEPFGPSPKCRRRSFQRFQYSRMIRSQWMTRTAVLDFQRQWLADLLQEFHLRCRCRNPQQHGNHPRDRSIR